MSFLSLGSALGKLCWNSATCMCDTPPTVSSCFSSPGSWLPHPCVHVIVCVRESVRRTPVLVDVELYFRDTFVLSCILSCLCSTADKPRNHLHCGAPEGRDRAGSGQRGGQPRHAVSEGQGSQTDCRPHPWEEGWEGEVEKWEENHIIRFSSVDTVWSMCFSLSTPA